MKLYKAIFETETDAFKVYRTAKNEKAFKEQYGGNGEIIKLEDVTSDYPLSLKTIEEALTISRFGQIEKDLILSIIQNNYENVI